MKDSGRMLRGGSLLPAQASNWARYIVRFVQAYEAEGIPMWGLTVQNEPMAVQSWESMIYTAEQERDFVRDHLGPALAGAGLGGRKLIVWDHNRDLIKQRADVILSDPEAAKYVWGIGFHWYETWAGGEPMHANVAAVREAWPDVNLLLTEATVERFDPARLQDWSNAERYGRQIIGDFNTGAVGWTDWNILLDERGGPNHVGNFCFAPVHADAQGRLVFTPSFAYLGHFSKFVRPGARRISAVSSRSHLLTTAFANADGRLAIVVMNGGDAPVRYRLFIGSQEVALTIPARAIQTLTG
jgi:glucosylceramidase